MKSGSDWERVRSLFQAAIEEPAERRHAYLASACGGDAALRDEVASLLAAHAAAGGFLETPAIRLEDRVRAAPSLALAPGDCVGDFEVVEVLGVGGMGEVYRARDRQLAREVAIKLLPPAFAAEPQRLARFERESRILASLNHPNIAAIHSIEQIDDLRLLVLELVEGPTLAARLEDGRVSVTDALTIARQLADALEAAHERGIVHRDLKPGNLKLGPAGRVVLLDFGLAKDSGATDVDRPAPAATPYTSVGLILGTCAYMSPEQARGQPTDKRTDIWAFGCILFELVSGRRAFDGQTPSDTIAAVLERQPDWSVLPESLPARIRTLLERCLEKDTRRRLHDIADARIEIEDALVERPSPRRRARLALGVTAKAAAALALALACVGLGWWSRQGVLRSDPASGATRFTWALPAGMRLESPVAVSPDGERIAFAASTGDAPPRLYLRQLRALDAQVLPRTEGAQHPFWSPDSRNVAYFARGKLRRVAIDGGPPIDICDAVNPKGGAWGSSNVIVFAPNTIFSGLLRVPAAGGHPEPATLLDGAQGENSHRWPAFLPDGIHFVYFVRALARERRGVYLGRVDGAATTPGSPIFRSESEAVYLPTSDDRGVLISAASGHVDVHPFDARRLALHGNPTTIDLPVGGNTPHHAAMLSGSANLLVHVPLPIPYGQRLVSRTRTGEEQLLDTDRGITNWPRVSPDGRRIVSQRLDALTGSPDLWVDDLERRTRLRLTQEGTSGQLPVWSPDGTRVAYVAGTFDRPVVTITTADGTGVVSTLRCPAARCEPSDWSRDGRWLLVTAIAKGTSDVWMLSVDPNGDPRPLLTGRFAERDARFSPDGRLVAYVSDETGHPEISVMTVDGPRRREVISVSGGTQPMWSRGGIELLFVDPDGVLRRVAVGRTRDGRPTAGSPAAVGVPPIGTAHYGTQYDLSPDGRRVYFLDARLPEPPREIGLVLAWRELLK